MMNRFAIVGIWALALGTPLSAFATAQRTFVASNGNDARPCSLAQPCRSFASAAGKTSADGEVVVLDSAGYGPVYLTQSVSIIAPPGVYAGVSVPFGIGITIDGTGIKVVLRGLSINGQGGTEGIRLLHGAALTVERCEITNMSTYGISVLANDGTLTVKDSVLRNNFTGIVTNPTSGNTRVSIGTTVIADSANIGVEALAASGSALVSISRSVLTGNAYPLAVNALPGAYASILSDGNTITYSTVAFLFVGAGGTEAIYTPGNNTVGYFGAVTQGGAITSCCGT